MNRSRISRNPLSYLVGFLLISSPLRAFENIQLKTTLAAPAAGKSFNPAGAAVDRGGQIWVSDLGSNSLILYSSAGVFVGQYGGPGKGDGQFDQPHGIATDLDGQVYVADTGNDRIEIFGPDGKWRSSFGEKGSLPGELHDPWTLAVSQDGVVAVAAEGDPRVQFFSKFGIFLHAIDTGSPIDSLAFDVTGRLYTAHNKLRRVVQWASTGQMLKSFNGDESGIKPLAKPENVAVTPTGVLYVADHDSNQIRELDLTGHTLGSFGRTGSGEGQFKTISSLAATSDALIVADRGNHRVDVYAVAHPAYLRALTPVPAFRVQVSLKSVWPIYADGLSVNSDGQLLAISAPTGALVLLDRDGKTTSHLDSKQQLGLKLPTAAVSDIVGNLYFADAGGNRVVKSDFSGHAAGEFGQKNSMFKGGQGELAAPANLAYARQNIYVADTGNGRFQVFNDHGIYLFAGGSKGKEPGQLKSPTGIAVDNDRVYVADSANHKIVVFNSAGRFLKEIGLSGGEPLDTPKQVAVDREGNIYVLDTGRGRVLIYDDQGQMLAGFGSVGKAKGFFYKPQAFALSEDGRLFVSDEGRIQVFRVALLPPAPTGLEARPGEGYIELHWQPAKTRFPAKYLVYRAAPQSEPERIKETVDTTVSDDTLQPGTTYTYTIISQSVQGAESVPSAPAQGMARLSKNGPRVEIVAAQIDDIFSANYKRYARTPVGTARIRNNSPAPFLGVKLSFVIHPYMDFPSQIDIPELHGFEQREMPLLATLNNRVLDVTETTTVQAQVKLDYYQNNEPMSVARSVPFKLYSRNSIRWDKKERFGAFVTPNDPPVLDFSRGSAVPFVTAHRGGPINSALTTAWALFEGLGTYGINYTARPTNPYDGAALDTSTIDTMQFPRETLARKSGDCADIVALLASGLESLGVATSGLEVPGHLLLMFDTGEADKDALGFPDSLVVSYAGTYWIPVEATAVGTSFTNAWKQGAEEYRRWAAQGKLTPLDIHEAWQNFEPATLPGVGPKIPAPARVALEQKFLKDWQALVALRWETGQAAAKAALTNSPNSGQPYLDLGFMAFDFKRLPEAKTFFMKARDDAATAAAAYNNLGNLAFLQKDLPGAETNYKMALDKDPADPGISLNLARLYLKQGLAQKASLAFKNAVKLDPTVKDRYGDVSALAL